MPYISIKDIETLSKTQGFCAVGADSLHLVEGEVLHTWLENHYHANMQYMENNQALRLDPRLFDKDFTSIVCFLYSYNDIDICHGDKLKVATYAQRQDYHYLIKDKLRHIVSVIQRQHPDFKAQVFTDSAPILERYWAERCGLGWIGKSSMLINPHFGSKVFIGEILMNYSTDYCQKRLENHCKGCNLCIKSCPNHAIGSNNMLDSRLCTSYHSIESKEDIPQQINTQGYIYGCDICLNACPWNKKAEKIPAQDPEIKDLLQQCIAELERGSLDKSLFNRLKKKTSLSRVKYEKLLANVQKNR